MTTQQFDEPARPKLRVMDAPGSLAVVIPSLNEQRLVAAAVASVVADASEVFVVDGGSTDATVSEAQACGARVLRGPRGRASQMDAGASVATAEWLVFLHADTRLGEGWADALRCLPEDVVGGAFRFSLDSPRLRYRLVEFGVALRCRLLQLPYGDQALFARRRAYGAVGGFGRVPILEDVDFIRRLRRLGRLAFPSVAAFTSARRWEECGIVSTTLRNWCVMLLDAAGVSRERLARFYGVRSS